MIQIKKHSSVKVPPETKVYFDIRKFDVGELLEFEITMDLFFSTDQSKYEFYIEQVPANNYYDSYYWDKDNLRYVTNKNVSCEIGGECTFSWEEIKQAGKNYIYIIPTEPYPNFYTSYYKEIEIEHLGGGLSDGAIAGIAIGCIIFVVIIVIIFISCCCFSCCPSGTIRPGIISGPTAVSVTVATPIYPLPVYPQAVYQTAVPYSSGVYI